MATATEQAGHPLEQLKEILENLRFPERLDAHPWADSLTVQAAVVNNPSLTSKKPGAQLVLTVGELFRQTMPTTPPQHSAKRLDTRWGRFGILAANYFAPLLYGRLYPRSLREAWRRIDPAILLFVYELPAEELKPEQIKAYQLLGDELDLPANSTISDWHRDGLQELAESFVAREQSLSLSTGKASILLEEGTNQGGKTAAVNGARVWIWRLGAYAAAAAVLVAGVLLGVKAYDIYQRVQVVRQDISALSAIDAGSFEPATLRQVGPLLAKTHEDVVAVQAEVSPFLWLTRRLGWVPVHGGDLKYADELLATAAGGTDAASQTYLAAIPIWDAVQESQDLQASQLTQMLIATSPALLRAQATLREASTSRQRINDAELSPDVRGPLTRMDTLLSALDGGLSLGLSVPGLLGGTASGPKTYLILVENEDELRPTGGFIAAVGKAVVWNGGLIDLEIEDSYAVDDINKAYPVAPWQMQSFMNIPIMVFRDASWFTDYPTAVRWAEYLYAYTYSYSVDGVIAIDQHVMEQVLSVTGPVYVSAINATVSAENLRTVMRAQKIPPSPDQRDPDWHRKQFMNPISAAILERLTSGQGVSWEKLLRAMMDALDQRHLLVQLDDPTLAQLLSERGWDGAVRSAGGDFLMVVDTNVGYNKTNAVVSSRLVYDVDLTDTATPRSSLEVFHQNEAEGQPGPCDERPSNLDPTTQEAWYAIDRCYYDYLRVYVPAGTQLTAATPHPVTRDEMVMLEANVPARVDILEEPIENVQGFGTLLVVPMQGSLETDFQFGLPATILQPGAQAGELVYALKIQKQAGTVAVPVTVRVHLPQGAQVESAVPNFSQDGDNILFDLDLKTDIGIRIRFRP